MGPLLLLNPYMSLAFVRPTTRPWWLSVTILARSFCLLEKRNNLPQEGLPIRYLTTSSTGAEKDLNSCVNAQESGSFDPHPAGWVALIYQASV